MTTTRTIPEALRELEREIVDYNDYIEELAGAEDEDQRKSAEVLEQYLFESAEDGLAAVPAWEAAQRAQRAKAKSLRDYYADEVRHIDAKIAASTEAVRRVLLRKAGATDESDLVEGHAAHVKSSRVNVSLVRKGGRRATKVTVPPELLPREYQRRFVEADVRAIGAALEAGDEIAGCILEPRGFRVSWRTP